MVTTEGVDPVKEGFCTLFGYLLAECESSPASGGTKTGVMKSQNHLLGTLAHCCGQVEDLSKFIGLVRDQFFQKTNVLRSTLTPGKNTKIAFRPGA